VSAPAVACIGAINVDTTLRLEAPGKAGTSNPATRSASTGGVAHNVARNLARLGAQASLVTAVGDDPEGAALLEAAAGAGLEIGHSLRVRGARSGSYTAVIEPDGELVIGAVDLAVCDALDPERLAACWPAIEAADLVFADCNLPAETLALLSGLCRRAGRPFAVDTVSAVKARRLPATLAGVDILFTNRAEAAAICGEASDALAQAERLAARGAATAVVTDGAAGLAWARPGESGRLPAVPVRVRDVSGAGDALVAACLAGSLQARPLEDCLRMGLAAAALTAAVLGPFSARLSLDAVSPAPERRPA